MRMLFGYVFAVPVQMFQDVRDYRHFRFSQLQVFAPIVLAPLWPCNSTCTGTDKLWTNQAEDIELLACRRRAIHTCVYPVVQIRPCALADSEKHGQSAGSCTVINGTVHPDRRSVEDGGGQT